jgi:hypothetical protein
VPPALFNVLVASRQSSRLDNAASNHQALAVLAQVGGKLQVNSAGKVTLGLKVSSGTREWLGGVMLVPLLTAALDWCGLLGQ